MSYHTLVVTFVNDILCTCILVPSCSTSLAESHAKLSLRSEVTEQDAVMAVYLYEECISARIGND